MTNYLSNNPDFNEAMGPTLYPHIIGFAPTDKGFCFGLTKNFPLTRLAKQLNIACYDIIQTTTDEERSAGTFIYAVREG